ncbi:MAG: FKBP-type peptidyl-prolyl cis-trans isomerase [Planctomycetota bacterium]
MITTKHLVSFVRTSLCIAVLSLACAGEATPQPQQIQIQPPKSESVVRTLELDQSTGELSPDGQKLMAKMIQENWRAVSMTSVQIAGGTSKLAVLFTRPIQAPPATPPASTTPPAPSPQASADAEAAIAKTLLATFTGSDLQTTASGLKYRVIRPGIGKKPALVDSVRVRYLGCRTDGQVFDASTRHGGTSTFALSQVIPGWTEGLTLMEEGSVCHFVIKPELAYGSQNRPGIGANQTLLFEVELLSVLPAK